jgi:MipA family protein
MDLAHRAGMRRTALLAVAAALAVVPALASAQTIEAPPGEESVFDGDWISVGFGALYGPSYDGSDDYTISPAPLVQGSLGGVRISPRPAGLALDLIPDPRDGIGFAFGPSARLRSNRASDIKDPVVEAAGKVKRAIEVGAAAGVSLPKVLNPYGSLSFGLEARWDVNGAHRGMVLAPSVSYFTPVSRGAAVILSLDAEHGDGDFADYYYSVSPAQSAASGLPLYSAQGGFTKAGATLIAAIDLDGNLLNGGLAATVLGGYSRMLGDAARTPYTAIRGRRDQWMIGGGLGYTF